MSEEEDKSFGAAQMSEAEFASARERYELGTNGLIELSDEYGISRQALSKRFKNNGVVKGSRAHEMAKAHASGVKEAVKAAAERFADKRAEWIEETRIQGVSALKQARLIGQKTVIDAVKTGSSMESIGSDLKAIAQYNKMLIDNLEGTLRILRSDDHIDEDDLPNLIVEDLTDQEILDHHKSTGAMPEDMTVEEMLAEEIGTEEIV